MPTDHRAALAMIKSFPQLIAYLRDEMGWPIARDSFEEVDDLFYDFTAEELGIDPKTAAKIESIKRLRPLSPKQPWGIFFVKFEPKNLPVVALRRILGQVALKKRPSANSAERAAWAADDLLFISNYGEGDKRQITFAHFSKAADGHDLPTLKVLGWDNLDTALHLDAVAKELTQHLSWPHDDTNVQAWRQSWRAAFNLRHHEVVATSRDLSIRLAELARAIRDRIKAALAIETEAGPLTTFMKAFQEALVHDLDSDGFADMYAQTIAYGLLSARIADPDKKTADDFAAHMRTNPFLRELMETFLKVGGRRGKAGGPGIDFDELGVSEVVELLDDANMEAVVRDFGDRNPQEDPVIHFYELFLKEYDAKKRMQRGVFYTPRPVVSYIVRSVDMLLRTEFGLVDGLADTATWGEMAKRHKDLKIPQGVSPNQDFVQILDPATGTGTFLVEVIDLIHRSLVAKWTDQGCTQKEIEAFWNEYVAKHLLPRLHGYELLMAPYAIAHLKIGLKLYETGYRFGSDERARIYLTNALEPAHDLSSRFEFAIPALAHEAKAVNEIKRNGQFTVVIGNPPYAGHSANVSKDAAGRITFIGQLIEDYKSGCPELFKPAQAKWLHDDYVKFIRFDQWLIGKAKSGVLGLITNHSYIDNPTFRGMRRDLKSLFGQLRVLDLHGSSKKKERAPSGETEENVFDIQQGVAILLATTRTEDPARSGVFHLDVWGARDTKYKWLLSSSIAATDVYWSSVPSQEPQHLFEPQDQDIKEEYEQGWRVPEIFSVNGDPAPGMVTTQDEFAIAFSKREIIEHVETLIDTRTEADARKHFRLCSQAQWNYKNAKRELRASNWRDQVTPVLYRPFDVRWTVFSRYVAVHRRERVMRHMLSGENIGLVTARSNRSPDMDHFLCSRLPTETKCGESTIQSYLLPLYLMPEDTVNGGTLDFAEGKRVNLSGGWVSEISKLIEGPLPELSFNFIYAILYSPTYRTRYAEFLKSDFPRVPLPGKVDIFLELSRLGQELVELHLLESSSLENLITTFTGPKNPEVGRVGWSNDTVWLDAPATRKGQPPMPGTIGFQGVPEAVWNFHVGGYQVCEKWLKDRKGRTLSKADIAHYQRIVVALTETIRLMKDIDEVIETHGGWPGAFQAAIMTNPQHAAMMIENAPSKEP
ncbi:type ISP restriction/modification enzyme [Bradyrhizobium hipponense]|nr:type ISP restriction/modification enzyme [Bradyrhizobium hipponense]